MFVGVAMKRPLKRQLKSFAEMFAKMVAESPSRAKSQKVDLSTAAGFEPARACPRGMYVLHRL